MASVFCVIQDELTRQVLLLQRAQDTSRPCQYSLPGGRRKHIEPPDIAIIREVFEETKLTINGPKLIREWEDQAYFFANVHSPSVYINKESMAFVWINATVSQLQAVGEIMNYRRLLELQVFEL
ncbi:MAG: NUDIX domain-containing protein [Pirellula sp.]|jgi:ADP-ribose pyrophosphatase YjhB (NUDIX family)